MKKYEAIENVILRSGLIVLSPDQESSRAGNVNPTDNRSLMLEKISDGKYQINGSIQFKIGEQFEWDGDTSRMGGMVKIVADSKPEIKPKAEKQKSIKPKVVKLKVEDKE